MKIKKSNYTCSEYRAEMILLSLQNQLNEKTLSEPERKKIEKEIKELEADMGMD